MSYLGLFRFVFLGAPGDSQGVKCSAASVGFKGRCAAHAPDFVASGGGRWCEVEVKVGLWWSVKSGGGDGHVEGPPPVHRGLCQTQTGRPPPTVPCCPWKSARTVS